MTYFTVDRRIQYHSGMAIGLQHIDDSACNNNEIVANLKTLYSEGFSEHGCRYILYTPISMLDILNNPAPGIHREAISASCELVFELVRQASYPKKPSRYQSMFAWETLEQALTFRNNPKFSSASDSIFDVSPQSSTIHKGDMNLMNIADSLASLLHRAHLYWQGKTLLIPNYQTIWEILIPLPALIGEQRG